MKVEQTDFTAALSQNAEKLLGSSPEKFNAVLKQHNITPEALNDMVSSIRDWLKKQPHLPEDKFRDQQIIGTLLFRGFSVEKVKQNIDMYFSARHRMPEFLCDRDPLDPKILFYMKQGCWTLMPKQTPEGYRVSIMRIIPTENFEIVLNVKVGLMLAEYRFWNETSLGEQCIIDVENFTLQDSLQITPVMIAKIVQYVTVGFGTRLKGLHVVNLPPFAGTLLGIFKKLLKPKLAERVIVSSREEVLRSLPKECLPVDYGGVGASIQEIADEWCKTLQSDAWRQFFLEQNTVFSDESKRLIPNSADELFGADGSFRKLALD